MIAVDTNPTSRFRDTIYVAWDVSHLLPFTETTFAMPGEFTLLLSRSTNHGVTFSTPILPIGPTGSGVSRPYAAYPFVGPDGTLYLAYEDSVQSRIAVVSSTNGGQTLGSVSTIGPPRHPLRADTCRAPCVFHTSRTGTVGGVRLSCVRRRHEHGSAPRDPPLFVDGRNGREWHGHLRGPLRRPRPDVVTAGLS